MIPNSQSSSAISEKIPAKRSDAARRQHAISYLLRSSHAAQGTLKAAAASASKYLRESELSISDERIVELKECLAYVDEVNQHMATLLRQLQYAGEITKLLNKAEREQQKEERRAEKTRAQREARAAKKLKLQQDQK